MSTWKFVLISKILTAIVCSLFLFSSPYITSDTKNDSSKDSVLSPNQQKIDKKELEGIEVRFDYSGHPKEREAAFQYFLKRYPTMATDGPTPITREQIGIFLYDLDNDGQKEILCYLNNDGYCGLLGCSFGVIKMINNNTQELIEDNLVVRNEIKILNTIHLGYHDLWFHSTFGNKPIAIWRWNGKYYDYYK
jgi:hypothetical protein